MLVPPQLHILVSVIWSFYKDWWWLVSPPVLLFLLHDFWLLYVRWRRFWQLEWILLEVKPPQIVERTPQAMEQVFHGLHGMWNKPKVTQKYRQGEVPHWFTCEIASINGETHFYIRVKAQFRKLVESHVWAQYPDAEIHEADDYTLLVPRGIPNEEWEMTGTEFQLAKPEAYPIRTYIEFESTIEEQRLDPLSALLEVMSSLHPGEQLWLQLVAQPVIDKDWKAGGEAIIAKLIGRPEAKKPGLFSGAMTTVMQEVSAIGAETLRTAAGTTGEAAAPSRPVVAPSLLSSIMMQLPPHEKEVVEAVGRKIGKLGYRCGLRVVYVAKREVYNSAMLQSIFGSVRQFNTQNLNSLVPNTKTLPTVYYVLPKQRNFLRKRLLDWRYRIRFFTRRQYILNTEELGTLFHFPGFAVAKAPQVSRIEAKRAEPPPSLPTI